MKTAWTACAVAGLVIGVMPAFAQKIPISRTGMAEHVDKVVLTNGLNQQDMAFLRQAATINMAEVMLGKLAQEKGDSWAKGFGADMEREHSGALEELRQLAERKGVTLPHDIDMKHQQLCNRLSRMNGSDFETAYRAAMISGHGAAANVFAAEIERGHDEMVRDYAVKILPGVKMHQMLAMDRKTMKGQ